MAFVSFGIGAGCTLSVEIVFFAIFINNDTYFVALLPNIC